MLFSNFLTEHLVMCEVVEQLGEHFEARFEAIEKCRELVGDHPEEREEVGYKR